MADDGQRISSLKQKEKDSKIVDVHNELIEILEELRKRVSEFSYGSLDKTLSYKDLTLLLAKKIKKGGRII